MKERKGVTGYVCWGCGNVSNNKKECKICSFKAYVSKIKTYTINVVLKKVK